MDESFKKELIEHCKRQMQYFERMGRTDSFAYKEHAVFLSVHIYLFNIVIVMIDIKKKIQAARDYASKSYRVIKKVSKITSRVFHTKLETKLAVPDAMFVGLKESSLTDVTVAMMVRLK